MLHQCCEHHFVLACVHVSCVGRATAPDTPALDLGRQGNEVERRLVAVFRHGSARVQRSLAASANTQRHGDAAIVVAL